MSSKKKSCNIFISHSSENKEIAEHLCSFLGNLGIKSDTIFCSSLIGQGVDNGEKLNNAIAKAIKTSSLLLYLISHDFLASSYCMEELGVGWYLDIRGKADCYYLVLPDIELSELKGFVNSKIDKFSFIDQDHRDDLGLFAENICKRLGIKMPRHSKVLNAENIFFSAVNSYIDDLKARIKRIEHEESEKKNEITKLHNTINDKGDTIKKLESKINQLNEERIEKENKDNKAKLADELNTIKRRFYYLGFGNGISEAAFKMFSKDFWFNMLNRYLELEKELEYECYDENMEMLAATIYSANGDYQKAYDHLVLYFKHTDSGIYPSILENITIASDNEMIELAEILQEKMKIEPEGIVKDSYKDMLTFINQRNTNKEASHA